MSWHQLIHCSILSKKGTLEWFGMCDPLHGRIWANRLRSARASANMRTACWMVVREGSSCWEMQTSQPANLSKLHYSHIFIASKLPAGESIHLAKFLPLGHYLTIYFRSPSSSRASPFFSRMYPLLRARPRRAPQSPSGSSQSHLSSRYVSTMHTFRNVSFTLTSHSPVQIQTRTWYKHTQTSDFILDTGAVLGIWLFMGPVNTFCGPSTPFSGVRSIPFLQETHPQLPAVSHLRVPLHSASHSHGHMHLRSSFPLGYRYCYCWQPGGRGSFSRGWGTKKLKFSSFHLWKNICKLFSHNRNFATYLPVQLHALYWAR